MNTITKSLTVVTVIISFIVVLNYYLSFQKFKPSSNSKNHKNIVSLTVDGDCNIIEKGCLFSISNKQFQVLFVGTARTMKPFNILVQQNNFEAEDETKLRGISVEFTMPSMNMGINRFKLIKKNETNIIPKWQGKILLPVCVSKRVNWKMLVSIETEKDIFELNIPVKIK